MKRNATYISSMLFVLITISIKCTCFADDGRQLSECLPGVFSSSEISIVMQQDGEYGKWLRVEIHDNQVELNVFNTIGNHSQDENNLDSIMKETSKIDHREYLHLVDLFFTTQFYTFCEEYRVGYIVETGIDGEIQIMDQILTHPVCTTITIWIGDCKKRVSDCGYAPHEFDQIAELIATLSGHDRDGLRAMLGPSD